MFKKRNKLVLVAYWLIGVLAVYGENVTSVKDCVTNKTCATAMITTTAKNVLNPTVTKKVGDNGVVRYNVSGNDNFSASTLKEIVVINPMPLNVTDAVTSTTILINGNTTKDRLNNSGNVIFADKNNSVIIKVNVSETTPIANSTNITRAETILRTNTTKTTPVSSTTTDTTEIISIPQSNNIVEVVRFVPNKYCYCDLMYNSCDINCCCDTDCSNIHLKSFTMCSDQEKSSLIKSESILFDSSLFYVIIDNVPSDYFYPKRDIIKSELQVTASLRNRDMFIWYDEKKSKSAPRVDPVYNSYDLTYKSLRWMYTIVSDNISSEIKTFSLKNSAFNSLCTIEELVEYLTAKETNCQIFIPNLTDVCNNDSSLSFKYYYSEKGLYKVVQTINSSVHKTEKIGLVTIQATAHHHCILKNGSSYNCRVWIAGGNDSHSNYHPIYSDGICHRVINKIQYHITHNGTRGVRAIDVHFYHQDVPNTRRPIYLNQKFVVQFVWTTNDQRSSTADTYQRSGKPGYRNGNPVLVSDNNTKRRRPKPMNIPESDENGMCNTNVTGRRQSLNFLENVNIQCLVRFRQRWLKKTEESTTNTSLTELCYSLQNEIISILGNYEGTLVSSLGDPDVATWIPIIAIKTLQRATPSDLSCPIITNKVHIQILFSQVGSFDSPQATILGVLVNYTTTTVVFDDSHLDLMTRDTNGRSIVLDVPIRVSVVFVDLTRPPIRTFAEPPTYEFKLPEDFYYPFWSSNNGFIITTNAVIDHYPKFEYLFLLIIMTLCSYLSRVLTLR